MSVVIFVLLSSQDGFTRKWTDGRAPALYNGISSTVAFLLGATTSIISGFLGMKIAVYANARTALEARKGIAPAFMAGKTLHIIAGLVDDFTGHAAFQCQVQILMGAVVTAAFRSGAVMGFLLAGNGLLVIYITIMVYKKVSVIVIPLCSARLLAVLQSGVMMPVQIYTQCLQFTTAQRLIPYTPVTRLLL